ncbi:VanZ family protein [Fulvivirga lutea]|uniref:VanZ family protein n=1 Tax=Fulvivirga lutea TaxID=2810512 RepID=A0A974WFF7_9BACT|nr:VanZ family protein [Fulvivirga lutea]QSE97499.1 VanZ family protein [Fulvivirga lutea]
MNKYYIASILWACLILGLTLTPGKSLPDVDLFSYDKLGHAGIFAIQAYLFVSGIYFDKKSVTFSVLVGLLITLVYGAGIEVAQEFIPDRGMEFMDLVANCAGSIIGISVFYISYKKNWQ